MSRYTAKLKIKAPQIDDCSFVRAHIPRKRIALVEDRDPGNIVAARRIREFLYDVGRELEFEYGWKAKAIARAGLTYGTGWQIIQGISDSVGFSVIEQISRATGCPIGVFCDSEVR